MIALWMSATGGALGGACDAIAVCPAIESGGGAAGRVAGSVAQSGSTVAAAGIFHAIGDSIDRAAGFTLSKAVGLVFAPVGGLDLHEQWFEQRVEAMALVTALLVFPLLVAASIGAIVRQDSGRLVRAWLVWLPVSTFVTACIVPLVSAALTVSDQMTSLVTAGSSTDVHSILVTLTPAAATIGSGLVSLMVEALVLLGAVVLWLELLVRKAAIYLTVLFFPLVLAGLLWPVMAQAVRRAVEVLAALVLSKFAIAASLSLGVAALGAPGTGVDGVFTGVAILLLAAFAPMALLRLVPVVEAAAIAQLEGRGRQPLRAATDAAGRVHRQMPLVARMLGADGGGYQPGGDGGGGAGRRVDPSASAAGAATSGRQLVAATAPAGAGGGAAEGPRGWSDAPTAGGGHGGDPGGGAGGRPSAAGSGSPEGAGDHPGSGAGPGAAWPDFDVVPGGIPYLEGTPASELGAWSEGAGAWGGGPSAAGPEGSQLRPQWEPGEGGPATGGDLR